MANLGYYICYPFAALLRLFYSLTGSYGISLILFTLVIKLILLPFQLKSKKGMMRMSRMSGKMQEIQKKYANNQIKMQEELQKLYDEEGANPMSGCVWSFLPMPILMALYYIIREPVVFFMNFGTRAAGHEVLTAAKAAVEASGLTMQSTSAAYEQISLVNTIAGNTNNAAISKFISDTPHWINLNYNFMGVDLSQVPGQHFSELRTLSWGILGLMLIPLISAFLSMMLSLLSTKNQPQPTASAAASSKMMIWMMPLMSLYMGFILPAALGIYWIAQSGFSYLQELLLTKFFTSKMEEEEDARHKQIEESRQARMEEARRHQEEQRQLSAKQQAVAKKKAVEASKGKGQKKASTTEAGRVGERPYARGRAFSGDHYQDQNNDTE